ncbi:MAG: T9SS type A sorting domain-containing protein [Bacteroidetes bacterium]|nr:T9SS type A sorting domain-containing protein [Bacteroidota bacterium]
MKKIFSSCLLICLSLAGFAQVPNGTFESWTPYGAVEIPTSWNTTDSVSFTNVLPQHSAVQDISDVQSGNASLRLTSWTFYASPGPIPVVPGLPGCASNGTVITNLTSFSITPTGGTPDNAAHGQLNGYYKYTPVNSDTGSVEVLLSRYNTGTSSRDTIATGLFKTNIQNNVYTQFSILMSRKNLGNPDTSLIWIQSSPRSPIAFGNGPGETGSTLQVDSLYFSSLIGIDEVPNVIQSVALYPVPAVNQLNIHVELEKSIQLTYRIFDVKGQLVASNLIEPKETAVDVSALANGTYYLSLLDQQNNALYQTHFTVGR